MHKLIASCKYKPVPEMTLATKYDCAKEASDSEWHSHKIIVTGSYLITYLPLMPVSEWNKVSFISDTQTYWSREGEIQICIDIKILLKLYGL